MSLTSYPLILRECGKRSEVAANGPPNLL